MVTARTAQSLDTANFIHGCFMVSVGAQFSTFKDILDYALRDESYGGTLANPALEKNVQTILNNIAPNDTDNSGNNNAYLPAYFSKRKCRDSSLGGNDAINPLPQFNIDDDIIPDHLTLTNNPDGIEQAYLGMGQVYSENYDDHQQILYLGFGNPVFSNLGNFWGSAVDKNLADFVNKGHGTSFEKIGYLLGAAPIVLINMATIPYKFIAALANQIDRVPITKYYSFSSHMPMYFRFVNTILVMLATNMNIAGSNEDISVSSADPTQTTPIANLNTDPSSPAANMSGISSVFKSSGLDMARIMTKRYYFENGFNNKFKDRNTDDALQKAWNYLSGNNGANAIVPQQTATDSTNSNSNTTNSDGQESVLEKARNWTIGWFDQFAAGYANAIYEGHLFIGFRIDKGLGASENFSNSTGESQVAQIANSKFQEARDIAFSSMNGKLGDGLISGAITSAISGIKSFAAGVSQTLSLDPLAAIATGAAKIDFPEVWMNSSYSRSASFTITCMSPYGDMESIFQSEYVPLACMLAGTLPRGTGQSSHSSPFVCQAYCRGVFSSPLCMIESLEVTRGSDQYGFNTMRLPLKLTMHVTLRDLTPVMYMSMGGNNSFLNTILASDDNFGEYMLTLSGMGLRDRLAPFRTFRRKVKILLTSLYINKTSPFMLGMGVGARWTISRALAQIVGGGRGLPGN